MTTRYVNGEAYGVIAAPSLIPEMGGGGDGYLPRRTDITDGVGVESGIALHDTVLTQSEMTEFEQRGGLTNSLTAPRVGIVGTTYWELAGSDEAICMASLDMFPGTPPVDQLPVIVRRSTAGKLSICGSDVPPVVLAETTGAPFAVGFNTFLMAWNFDADAGTIRFRAWVFPGTPEAFTGWGAVVLDHTVSGVDAGGPTTITGLSFNLDGFVSGLAANCEHGFDAYETFTFADDIELLAKRCPRGQRQNAIANGDELQFNQGVGPHAHPDYRHVNEHPTDSGTTYDACDPTVASTFVQLYQADVVTIPADVQAQSLIDNVVIGCVYNGTGLSNRLLRCKVAGVITSSSASMRDSGGIWDAGAWRLALTPGGLPWSASALNAMQIGMRRVVGANPFQVSSIWAASFYSLPDALAPAEEPIPVPHGARARIERQAIMDHIQPARTDPPLAVTRIIGEQLARRIRNERRE